MCQSGKSMDNVECQDKAFIINLVTKKEKLKDFEVIMISRIVVKI